MKTKVLYLLSIIALITLLNGCVLPEFETEEAVVPFTEIIYVEGGQFQMGLNSGYSEIPVRDVTLSDFYIGKYEVTQAEWVSVMGNNPSEASICNECPVDKVNWNDAQEFIKILNERTGKNFRLPTSAEWEYAARGGKRSEGFKYAGSNNLDEVAWYVDNAAIEGVRYGSQPVGTKQPNELGIYDMHGNVSEWCHDIYEGYRGDPAVNPTGGTSGMSRVYRGAAWTHDKAYFNLSTISTSGLPTLTKLDIGFRLCHDADSY